MTAHVDRDGVLRCPCGEPADVLMDGRWACVKHAEARPRFVTAVVEGTEHRIPEMWLAGICQSSGCTIPAAIAFWVEMAALDALEAV